MAGELENKSIGPVPIRFSPFEVREMLRGAGLPDILDDENVSQLGLTRAGTQRQRVMDAYRVTHDVNEIFGMLGSDVPKSSIRAYLSRANAAGEVGGEWRIRQRRRPAASGGVR